MLEYTSKLRHRKSLVSFASPPRLTTIPTPISHPVASLQNMFYREWFASFWLFYPLVWFLANKLNVFFTIFFNNLLTFQCFHLYTSTPVSCVLSFHYIPLTFWAFTYYSFLYSFHSFPSPLSFVLHSFTLRNLPSLSLLHNFHLNSLSALLDQKHSYYSFVARSSSHTRNSSSPFNTDGSHTAMPHPCLVHAPRLLPLVRTGKLLQH